MRNFVVILGMIVISSISFYTFNNKFAMQLEASISVTILFATFLAIVWYTVETNRMQRAIVQQTELSIRPILSMLRHRDSDIICVTNIGNGTAINVKIFPTQAVIDGRRQDIYFDTDDLMSPNIDEIDFSNIQPGHTKKIRMNIPTTEESKGDRKVGIKEKVMQKLMRNLRITSDICIKVSYKDILGKKCYQQGIIMRYLGTEIKHSN